MGELTKVSLGSWLPDFVEHEMPDGALIECKNLIPYTEFFAAAYSANTLITTSLSGTPMAGVMYKDSSLIKKTFVGTTQKLYEIYGNTLSDKSPTAAITTSLSSWDFEQYGNWVIATNNVDAPLVLKGFSEANFIPLANAPSTAKFVHFNNGHLIFANTDTDIRELEWSAWQDIEDYTPSLTTGAGSKTLSDSDGEITGIAAVGSLFAIFHPESVTLGHYTGFPYTFNFVPRKVRNVGGIQGTMVSVGNLVFFWDYRDIYVFDGATETAIGSGVRRKVLNELDTAYVNRITSSFDPYNRVIYWAYPTVSSSDGTPDKVLCLNIETKKFSWLDMDVQALFRLVTGGITMDNIDTIYTDIDQMPYHMDSVRYKGSQEIQGCCSSGLISTLDGAVLTGEIITRELSSGEDVLMISRVRPNISDPGASSVTGYVGSRMRKAGTPSWSDGKLMNTSDNCDIRKSGRLLRVKVTTGGHSGFSSIDVDIKKVSGR